MDVNRRAEFREAPRSTSVIKMNMTEKYLPDVLGGKARLPELLGYVVEGRLRSGVEEQEPIVRLDRCRGDNASPAELSRIENMNH
jgi:hypothetical protein